MPSSTAETTSVPCCSAPESDELSSTQRAAQSVPLWSATLGTVTKDRIKPDPAKTVAVRDMGQPKDEGEMDTSLAL